MTDPIDHVLNIMSGSYMSRWRLKPEEELAWREGLKGFSRDVLRAACNHARVDYEEWPPTLMRFRRYCISERDRDSEFTGDEGLAAKWNKWAEEKCQDGFKLRHKLPGESLEEYRKYLVMEFDRQKRGVSTREQLAIIAENAKANREQRQMYRGRARGR